MTLNLMHSIRIIGDVHAQVTADDLFRDGKQCYLDLIEDAAFSIQIGDMGDGETYAQLARFVDPARHRFIAGNHDHYDELPTHSLGEFGAVNWGVVDFFFIRGAESSDRERLIERGKIVGKRLWFSEEQLTDSQMDKAAEEFAENAPEIVLSHDAPEDYARYAWEHARQFRRSNAALVYQPSRTTRFLARLLTIHRPKLWLFGHHHHNWTYEEDGTTFVCVGELSSIDIDSKGTITNRL